MEKANRKYILTQGPLKQTVGHFWQMVWEQNSTAILMLNKLIEKNTVKCHKYWPEHIGAASRLVLSDCGLTVEYLKCEEYTNYMVRTLRLTDEKSSKSREVLQFHYVTWPDFCIPSSPIAFLQFLKKVRDSGVMNADVGPAIVHCSAGIGRSGTFCLVDTALVLVSRKSILSLSRSFVWLICVFLFNFSPTDRKWGWKQSERFEFIARAASISNGLDSDIRSAVLLLPSNHWRNETIKWSGK